MKKKINEKIIEAVEAYRRASGNLRNVKFTSPQWERSCNMMMDRASGALDVLCDLYPDAPAWRETEWTS